MQHPVDRRGAIAPLYLFASIVLGSSSRMGMGDFILQIGGVVVIAWAVKAYPGEPLERPAKQLLMLVFAAVLFILLQTVPIPKAVWAYLPQQTWASTARPNGHAEAFSSISLAPRRSLLALLGIIPPVAIFFAIVRCQPFRSGWFIISLSLGAAVRITSGAFGTPALNTPLLGAAEGILDSGLRLSGSPDYTTGLLVIVLPFLAAIAPQFAAPPSERHSGLLLISGTLMLLAIAALLSTGAGIGYVLGFPVLAASLLIMLRLRGRLAKPAVVLVIFIAVATVAFLTTGSIGIDGSWRWPTNNGDFGHLLAGAIPQFLPEHLAFGSGLASAPLMPVPAIRSGGLYTRIALELGIPGIALMGLFGGWFIAIVRSVTADRPPEPMKQAAAIAIVAVLVQSLVEDALSTAMIYACFAACLGILTRPRGQPHGATTIDVRPARHLSFK